jgi:hypothetical protein
MLRVSPDRDRTKLTPTQVQQLAAFFRVAPGAMVYDRPEVIGQLHFYPMLDRAR